MVVTWLWYGCDFDKKRRLFCLIDTFAIKKLCHLFAAYQNNTLRKISTVL